MNMDKLKISSNSCRDYVLYYGIDENIGFEAQFDENVFNGVISFCDNIGCSDEEWNIVEDEQIYKFIKEKAINDFDEIVRGM